MHDVPDHAKQLQRVIRHIELSIAAARHKTNNVNTTCLDEMMAILQDLPGHCQLPQGKLPPVSRRPAASSGSPAPTYLFSDFFQSNAAQSKDPAGEKAGTTSTNKEDTVAERLSPGNLATSTARSFRLNGALLGAARLDGHRLALDTMILSVDRLLDLTEQCAQNGTLTQQINRLLDLLGQSLHDLAGRPQPLAS